MRELVVGIAGAGKSRHCLDRCAAALAAGREVLYLVPNAAEAGLVRGRLLERAGGAAALLPGILTPRVLARRLLDAALPGWSERDALARRLQLVVLLREAGPALGPLARSAGTAGFPATLDALLAELEAAGVEPAALGRLAEIAPTRADADRLRALAEVATRFLAARAPVPGEPERLDASALAARAAALLDARGEELLPVRPLVLLDGFSHLAASERRFLEALLRRADGAALSLCLDPVDLDASEPRPPFEGLVALARALRERGDWTLVPLRGEQHRYADGFLAGLARGLFRGAPGEGTLATGESLGLIQGATPRDEVEGVLREIRRCLSEGLAPGDIAVLFRQNRYGDLLAELLDRNGIPFHWERRRALVLAPAVDLALTLLDWAAGVAEPADLPQRLRGFVTMDDALLAEIAAQGRARGLPGAGDWGPLLDEARRRDAEADWSWLDWCEGLGEPALLAGAAFVARWLDPLVALLLPALSAGLESALSAASPDAGANLRALAGEVQSLERLGGLARGMAAALSGERPPAEWTALLRRAAEDDQERIVLGREGGGVLLGNPFELRLPELDTVFVCGLNEGVFPTPFRENPLLRDAERQKLGADLPDWNQRRVRERYLFYVACTRPARRLWLCHAMRDREGRPLAPSQYLTEVEQLCQKLPEAVKLPPLSIAEKLRDPVDLRGLLRDRLLAGVRREAEALADEAESWLRGRGFGSQLDEARLTRCEGPLTGHPALAMHLGERAALSASRLEDFAECPFRFLGRHLLGLREEGDYEAGALEEGRLLHHVLDLFYREHGPDSELDLAAEVARLHERARAELVAGGLHGVDSPRFRAGDARRRRMLVGFLGRDRERLLATHLRPRADALEWRFELTDGDLPGEPLPAAGAFTIYGVADRVDVDPDGRELVLDYKRGDKHSEAPDVETPTLFQLALYARARQRAAGPVAGAAYCALRTAKPFRGYFRESLRDATAAWSIGAKGGTSTGAHWLDDAQWEDWQAQVGTRLREIVRDIRGGLLAPSPRHGEDSCARCELQPLCRWTPAETQGGIDV